MLATGLPALSIVRDPEDNIILATAVAGAADYLCSRDRDLLELHHYYEIMIVSPEDLLGCWADVSPLLVCGQDW